MNLGRDMRLAQQTGAHRQLLFLRVAIAGLEQPQRAAADKVEGVGDDRVQAILCHGEFDDRALGGRRSTACEP